MAEALGLEPNDFGDVNKLARAVFDAVRESGEEESLMPTGTAVEPEEQDLVQAEAYATKWIDLIKMKEAPSPELGKWIVKETFSNFQDHFNAGWLEYRKSVCYYFIYLYLF